MLLTYKKQRLEEMRYVEDYKGIPKHILRNYQEACTALEASEDLEEVYRVYNYPTPKKKGKLSDVRVINLNDAWRLFFKVKEDWNITIIHITDVNNHDYKKQQ